MSTALSSDDIREYFDSIINPSFAPLINCNVIACIWDIDGTMKIATNKYARIFGFNSWEAMIGRNAKTDTLISLPVIAKAKTEMQSQGIDVLQQVITIRDKVIQNKIPISAILIHPFAKVFNHTLIIHQSPIFHPNGETIGVELTLNEFDVFGINDYLDGFNDKSLDVPSSITDTEALQIRLTSRQHEIIFLIALGLSQREAAQILNISRSTIAKTLIEIADKFEIYSSDTSKLITKARKLNIHKQIPSSLCKPWVIVLDV